MMKTIARTNISFAFDPSTAPAAHAASGETVCFQCLDCYTEQIDCDGKDFALLDMDRNNPITGPLFVDGAEPGDTLKVEIQQISLGDHGVMCVRAGVGTYEVTGCHCRHFPIRDGVIHFDEGVRLAIRPMIGVIGTCPAGGPASTLCPGEHGGNMDIRELGVGSVLYLPVCVPGALLSLGDIHAVQGDGETAICAMEISGEVVLRVSVIKSTLPTPFLVTEHACFTTAADPSLDVCSVQAARKMHRWLAASFALSDAQAAMLLSLNGNLRISQIVNPLKGCMMELALDTLRQLPRDAGAAPEDLDFL